MPFFNKKKIYNRVPAATSEYIVADPFGISTGLSAITNYFLNDDNYVQNYIDDQKEILNILNSPTRLKEEQKRLKITSSILYIQKRVERL